MKTIVLAFEGIHEASNVHIQEQQMNKATYKIQAPPVRTFKNMSPLRRTAQPRQPEAPSPRGL